MLFLPVLILFAVCILIQVIFLVRMFLAFSGYQGNVATEEDVGVSVVVCAHNEHDNLQKLIPQLCTQEHTNYEVIIVDDRSNDDSDLLIREFQKEFPHLRMMRIDHLPENMNGKKYALTLGIKGSRKKNVLLTDADCIPGSGLWIRQMTQGFNNDETDFILGFSMYNMEKGLINLFIRYETLWTAIHYLGLALSGWPYMGVGRNLAYRRELFLEKKGFRGFTGLTGGDDDIFVNKYITPTNYQVRLGAESVTWSVPKRKWKEFYRQKIRHLSVGRHYRPVTQMLLGVLSLSHIFGYIFMGILLFQPGGWIYGVAGFLVRTLWLLLTFKKACQKLEIPFSTGKILPMDLTYAVYYPTIGISAIFRKKVRWK